MENDNTRMLGPRGLIKKHEFVRVIIQCLYSLGYKMSASSLELQSGISLWSKDLEMLEYHLMDAKWEESICIINNFEGLTDEVRSSALYLVFRQHMLECLGGGDYSTALDVLRKRISVLDVKEEKIHNLASDLIFADFTSSDVEAIFLGMRGKLWVDIKTLLPSSIAFHDRRLEYLVEDALLWQVGWCTYHNSTFEVSLLEDHKCDKDQLPFQTIQVLTAHKNEVWFVQFSNNGKYLASSSSDCTAIIWEVPEEGDLTLKHTLRSHQHPVSFVAWSPDDTMLLTCGNLEVVKLWDVETGSYKRTFGGDDFKISSCAWFPDSRRIVCGSSEPEKGICIWDCDGNEIRTWREIRMPKILDLAVTADGNYLIAVLSDREIRITNMVTETVRVILEEHSITSLSVSADGKFLVNLNSQEIHLWDAAGTIEVPYKLTGHEQSKYVIRSCFGGFGNSFVASGSESTEVYIWRPPYVLPILTLSGHSMTVNCVSWSSARPELLASASDDQTVRIWGSSKVQETRYQQVSLS